MSEKVEDLAEEAIENIRKDREQTQELLANLMSSFVGSNPVAMHKEVAMACAKYVETLQRSNEQLVKLINIKSKKADGENSLGGIDIEGLYEETEAKNK